MRVGKEGMAKDKINITIERDLWDSLSKLSHQQSILKEKRYTTIQALRTAIHVFLKLHPQEVNQILDRPTRNIG